MWMKTNRPQTELEMAQTNRNETDKHKPKATKTNIADSQSDKNHSASFNNIPQCKHTGGEILLMPGE